MGKNRERRKPTINTVLEMEKQKPSKCLTCVHLIIKPHQDWGNSYSCAKMWYGGCSQPSKYALNMCLQTNDYKKKEIDKQLSLFP